MLSPYSDFSPNTSTSPRPIPLKLSSPIALLTPTNYPAHDSICPKVQQAYSPERQDERILVDRRILFHTLISSSGLLGRYEFEVELRVISIRAQDFPPEIEDRMRD